MMITEQNPEWSVAMEVDSSNAVGNIKNVKKENMSINKTKDSSSGAEGKTLGLVHTSATLVPVFAELCNKFLPHVKTFNIVDDSLIKNPIACGELTASTSKRVVNYAASAQEAGADFILFTCSSIGPAVET